MNVNLHRAPEDETIQEQIDEHIEIMQPLAPLNGKVLLLAEGEDYPGSYRVWLGIISPVPQIVPEGWVWIDVDGHEHVCPSPWSHALMRRNGYRGEARSFKPLAFRQRLCLLRCEDNTLCIEPQFHSGKCKSR